jgi:hypothetical protein
MKSKQKPRITSVIFCNAAGAGESGHIYCRDVFTAFLAWGYPTSIRSWFSVMTVHGLPEGRSEVLISISRKTGPKTKLATVEIRQGPIDVGNVVTVQLNFEFRHEGYYTVHFDLVGSTRVLKIPVKVVTQPWPQFTPEEIKFIRESPSMVKSIRTNIFCRHCSRPYVFEETVLPDLKLADNVYPFPDSGIFKCDSCGHKLLLKDIQGQIRSSFKTALPAAMKGVG